MQNVTTSWTLTRLYIIFSSIGVVISSFISSLFCKVAKSAYINKGFILDKYKKIQAATQVILAIDINSYPY